MERILIKNLAVYTGKEVLIAGRVDIRRDQGKLIFIDLRDMSGKVQMVALPNHSEAHTLANTVHPEWLIEVTGKVNPRQEKMIKPDEINGALEIEILGLKVLNEASTPAFYVGGAGRDTNKNRPSITKINLIIFAALMILFVAVGVWTIILVGKNEDSRLRKEFAIHTQTLGEALDSNVIESLTGTKDDLNNPAYQDLKQKIIKIKEVYQTSRFVYLMGYKNNQTFFFVDSELENSKDYSAPGDFYIEATPEQKVVFFSGIPLIEGPYKDSWGQWVSASAPIHDLKSGKIIAVIGIDIDSKKWSERVWLAQTLPIIIFFFVFVLIFLFTINRIRAGILIIKLQKSNQLIKQLTSFASHQLSTPLTGVKWALEVLNEDLGGMTENQKTLIKKIWELNNQSVLLVRDFLDMSHIERDGKVSINPRITNIANITAKVVADHLSETQKKNISIEVDESAKKERLLMIDTEKISWVIDNILSNAIKYSGLNTKITIKALADKTNYTLKIIDNGIGIPQAEQKHIFENFYRASNAKEMSGTGIGLYLVKIIMKTHKAEANFTSIEGKGSEFNLVFPA